ncbi:MAG: ABC transporter ATP-binding protein [Acidimicrobiia bacterium]
MTAVELDHITVFGGRRAVLRDVSMTIDAGTLCAVIGASGAGKSSLLRAIAGLAEIDGTITIGGQDATGLPAHRRGVAMLFQDPRLFDNMTVVDNVAYAQKVQGVARPQRRSRALDLLDEVGLVAAADEHITGLSGGERQRVALARALNAQPGVLLLDEPLSAIDAPRRVELRSLISRVHTHHGLTTIVVSHDITDVVALADTVAVIDDGVLLQHAATDHVLQRPSSPTIATLTGNPNVLHDGSHNDDTLFTVRPEHVIVGRGDIAMTVLAVENKITHRSVTLESPWGPIVAIVESAVSLNAISLCAGETVNAQIDPSRVWTFGATPVRTHDHLGVIA